MSPGLRRKLRLKDAALEPHWWNTRDCKVRGSNTGQSKSRKRWQPNRPQELMEKPVKPSLRDYKHNATTFANLSQAQQKAFETARQF